MQRKNCLRHIVIVFTTCLNRRVTIPRKSSLDLALNYTQGVSTSASASPYVLILVQLSSLNQALIFQEVYKSLTSESSSKALDFF